MPVYTEGFHHGIMTDGAFSGFFHIKEIHEIYGGTSGDVDDWQIVGPSGEVQDVGPDVPKRIVVITFTEKDISPVKVQVKEVSHVEV